MFKKFQQLIDNILESNAAGSGGALGTPNIPLYNPPDNVQSSDTYQPNDFRNVFGGVFQEKPSKRSRKSKKTKKRKKSVNKPLVIRRNLPKNIL